MSEMSCEPADGGGFMQATAELGRYCIIIDDDPGICKALSFTLRKVGFETLDVAAPTALDAALAARMPNLIFLDLSLGESGAMDVLPILAQREYEGLVQLMSGRSQEVMDEVAAAGARQGLRMLPALAKPFRMGLIKDLVASFDQS